MYEQPGVMVPRPTINDAQPARDLAGLVTMVGFRPCIAGQPELGPGHSHFAA